MLSAHVGPYCSPFHNKQVDRPGGKVSHKCHFPATLTEVLH